MSTGKAAARDLRYGRRGGRWAEEGSRASESLEAVHTARLAAISHDNALSPEEYADARKSDWPVESFELWRELAVEARARLADNLPLSEMQQRAIDVDDLAVRR